MIIDQLPLLAGDAQSTDELAIERGTTTYKASVSQIAPAPATATPIMDGTGAVGVSAKYAREDHVHPSDTSKQDTLVSGTTIKTVGGQSLLGSGNIDAGGALYYTSVACSAMTGNFATVSNAAITANHVVVSIVFANSSAITSDVTWTTASGSLTLNGTCASATTADIVLVLKNN